MTARAMMWQQEQDVTAGVTQKFQSSNIIMDIATYRLNPRGQCSETHLKCIKMWEGRAGVTITIFFPAYKGWTRDQLSIRQHPHKDLK